MTNEFELSFQGSADVYVILRRSEDAKVYDGEGFVTWNNADLADYAIALLNRGGDVYQGDMPQPLEQGVYRALYYLQAGEAPHVDDLLLATRIIHWDGQSDDGPPPAEPVEVNDDALTTVELVASYLRLGDAQYLPAAQVDLLASLVNQVSARIERVTGRQFVARDRVFHHLRVSSDGKVRLPAYPAVHVSRISTGSQPALRVRFDSATAVGASVSVVYDATGAQGHVRLQSVSSDGTVTTHALAMSDYASLASMATAIGNIAGWQAMAMVNALSAELHPTTAMHALGAPAMLALPADRIHTFDLQADTGLLTLGSAPAAVTIACRVGYETIPQDLQLIATQLVAQAYEQGRQNPSIKSESLGQYSYTLASAQQISDELWLALRPYMEVR